MTLKGGEFGVGLLLPLLDEVDSNPFVLLCPALVEFFPCWRALYRKRRGGVDHMLLYEYEHVLLSTVELKIVPECVIKQELWVRSVKVICKLLCYVHIRS